MAKTKIIDKEIKKIVFEFADKKKLTLEGEELERYTLMCDLYSDYFLPANENSKMWLGPIIKGFTPCPQF